MTFRIFLFCLFSHFSFSQVSFPIIAADTVYHYKIEKNDTSKCIVTARQLYIYDKQGHIREILTEKPHAKSWKYESRILFGYNAINRLQSYKKELWDSTQRDWKKHTRRTFAYNIRYMPIYYLDEVWSDATQNYEKKIKSNFEYNKSNKIAEATHKVWKKGVWSDSLRQNIIYDTLGKMIGFEEKVFNKDSWRLVIAYEYKFSKNGLIEEMVHKEQRPNRSFGIIGKTTFLYNPQKLCIGKRVYEYENNKRQYKEKEGSKSFIVTAKKQWIFNYYTIENNKPVILSQKVICLSQEKIQSTLPDFPFQLIEDFQ
jgi:hypothetical protein